MKIIIESTTKQVLLNGRPIRIWEGHTEAGIPIHAYVALIAVDEKFRTDDFDKDLEKSKPPSPSVASIPLRLVI